MSCSKCGGPDNHCQVINSTEYWFCPPFTRTYKDSEDPIQPDHYKLLSPEPLHVIEGWGLGFYEAQVIKYIARAGRKGGESMRLQDLKKAAFYLNRRIQKLEEPNGKYYSKE